jgi:hypothetical protein
VAAGRLLGARILVLPRLYEASGNVHLALRIIDVESGRMRAVVRAAPKAAAGPAQLAAAVAPDALRILSGGSLTPATGDDRLATAALRLRTPLIGRQAPPMAIVIVAGDQLTGTVKGAAAHILRGAGLRVTGDGGRRLADWAAAGADGRPPAMSAPVVLVLRPVAETTGVRGAFTTARARVEAILVDAQSGEVIATGRGGAGGADVAEPIALQQAAEAAVAEALPGIAQPLIAWLGPG